MARVGAHARSASGTQASPGRVAALDVLRAVRGGELADRALARALQPLAQRDRPWTQELIYGTLRLRARLDHGLAPLVRRGLHRLEPDVLDVLRLGAYQLLEMGSVPAYAAVSQAVELAKRASGRGAGGLVNGVLHALARGQGADFPSFERDPVEHLVTWGSHPRWLVERWLSRFGAAETHALVEANNRRPELYIRPIGLTPGDAADRLAAVGIVSERVDVAPEALRIVPPAGAAETLAAVPAMVQDPAAGLVVRYAAAPAGARVADLCAAPGGKALALTERASYLVAADLSFERLQRVRENAQRVRRSTRIGLAVANARWPPIRPVDMVLLDVPCTGTGTLRRHPDGKWRLRPADLPALGTLQRELLEAAASRVVPGGLLVYSTCSLEPEENEEQVDAFLERHPEYEPVQPRGVPSEVLDAAGQLYVLPQRAGVDGAFAARLRRRS